MSNQIDTQEKDSFEGLTIKKDRLFRRYWVKPVWVDDDYDKGVISEGYYAEKEITDELPFYLKDNCRIQAGTTLRDVFKLCEKHKDLFSILEKRNWFAEYLDYALYGVPSPDDVSKFNNDELIIDYLEVYYILEHNNSEIVEQDEYLETTSYETKEVTRTLIYEKGHITSEYTNLTLGFHGISKPLTKSYVDKTCGYTSDSIGKQIPIGFFGCDVRSLLDYEIRLCNTLTVCDCFTIGRKWNNYDYKDFQGYSLFDIIDAIFYELSFNGSPEDSEQVRNQVFESVKEIQKDCED